MLKVKQINQSMLYTCVLFDAWCLCTAPGDYNETVFQMTFGPGASNQTVSVPIASDGMYENEEIFFGNLRLPAGSQARVDFNPMRANAMIIDADCKSITNKSQQAL